MNATTFRAGCRQETGEPNPWGLSKDDLAVMDAFMTKGCHKLVADQFQCSRSAISSRLSRIMRRMGERHSVHAAIRYHDWRQKGSDHANPV